MRRKSIAVLLGLMSLASLVLSGCGRESVDSGDITLGINSMNESDIRTAGLVEKDENISTETGNPWGEFIKKAEDECGHDPVGFDVSTVSIALDTSRGSRTVRRFEDVIDGTQRCSSETREEATKTPSRSMWHPKALPLELDRSASASQRHDPVWILCCLA